MDKETSDYIGTIVSDRRRVDQEKILEQLFDGAIDKGMSIIVILIHPPVSLYFKVRKLAFYRANWIFMLSCNKKEDTCDVLKVVKKISPWRVSSIQFLIGARDLQEKLSQLSRQRKISLEKLMTKTLLHELGESVLGVVDPLDDDFNVYGKPEIRQLVEPYLN
jgi:hypothetical protein